jgi:menaquinone-specific isochorismate synthase
MTVLPCRANFLLDYKDLYQFLLACQQNCSQNWKQVVSISMEIKPVDPLVVLKKIANTNQLTFYYENKSKGEAIAAIDAVVKLNVEGKKRFNDTQGFIKSCLANTITVGNINHPFAGSHFFCIFGFFDKNTQADYPFPPATVFLPRWQVARHSNRYVLVANLVINAGVSLEILFQQLCQTFEKISFLEKNLNRDEVYKQNFIKQNVTSTDNFKRAVLSSLESIHANHLNKIVLAHALNVISDSPFNLFQSLNNLRTEHPNCYIFSTSNGKGQNFIGASPERLISIQNQELMTDALAGSAPRGKTSIEDAELANRLLNSEKESREHQVVIDFITQRLHQLGISPQLLPPQLRQLSNIQHLWTPIQAKVPANVHPLEIVAELHPTPAVAGVARDVACEQIRRYENFERGLYAAPLGWVNYQGNSEFIVGIRSALIDGDRASLYAGAGIVAGSDPDKELAEIRLKLQALLKSLV